MKLAPIVILLMALSGCANSFEKVRNAAANAPEWYGDAREEIIGEGYPDLASMPSLSREDVKASTTSIRMSKESVTAARKLFSSPRASAPITTAVEMRARREDLKAKLAASGPAPTGSAADMFLTEADLERFREIFRRAELR